MDRVQKNQAHEGKASDVARQILESYGFEADVTDTEISVRGRQGRRSTKRKPILPFVTKLAGRNDATASGSTGRQGTALPGLR